MTIDNNAPPGGAPRWLFVVPLVVEFAIAAAGVAVGVTRSRCHDSTGHAIRRSAILTRVRWLHIGLEATETLQWPVERPATHRNDWPPPVICSLRMESRWPAGVLAHVSAADRFPNELRCALEHWHCGRLSA